jgi:CheY-like chemotaxis protein
MRCLALRAADATVEWQVRDTGIGVAEDQMSELFKDFTQADASISRRFGGSGLGLAICKRLVEQMGGGIGVVSTFGKGSTFSFSLALPIAEQPEDNNEDVANYDLFAAHLSRLPKPLRILVADDIASNRLVVTKMLRMFNIEIDEVPDGAAAVAAASRMSYDLILMDVRMPVMNGLEAARAIRASMGAHADVPILAFTANAFAEDIKACFEAGMNDFLTKPVRKQDLVNAISWSIRAPGQNATSPESVRPLVEPKQDASADGAQLIDRGIFDEFVAAVGRDAAAEVLNMFLENAATRLQTLRRLSCDGDREDIKTEAHSLKSEAATLGLLRLSRLARTLEHSARDIDARQYADILNRLDATFELTRPELPIPLAA